MKKLLSIFILSVIFILCAFGLIACGESGKDSATIKKIEFNDKGQLVITLTDGTVLDPVEVPEKPQNECDKLQYQKIDGKEEYRVVGLGTYAELDLVIPSTYKGLPVTEIGEGAFNSNRNPAMLNVKSVMIPNSVTSIGNNAFDDCDSLQYNIESNLKYLGNEQNKYLYLADTTSTDITTTTINSNCKFIGSSAFKYCDSLTSITIPNSVTSIGSLAFYECDSLTSVTIPNSVTSIGNYAFSACSSLTSVTIGNSVTSIGNYAFSACSSLTSVTIGNSVTSIGSSAFSYCYSLTSVTIGNSVTSIGSDAFYKCDSLTSVTIPNSVTSIGNYAFRDCYSLTIYCEAESMPSGWNYNWNSDNRPVVWGYKG